MRPFWILFGIGAHLLFAVTVWRLNPFLQGTLWPGGGTLSHLAGGLGWWRLDLVLAAQFGLAHSVWLLPQVRRGLGRVIPSAQYGCVFCAVTCASLLATIELWQPSRLVLWQFRGASAAAVSGCFLLSWVALFFSLYQTGLGYQTGWAPWWAWVRGRALPPRRFEPRGPYRLLRHPVYLSFLGLVWFTPVMSADRALLTAVWTAYVFVGSYLKDRRLVHYLGAEYREYQARVPGYPFLPIGPLGRVAQPSPATVLTAAGPPRS